MQEAMKDPEYLKQMQQMQQMQQAMMQNPNVQAKMEALKSDPEFADEFAEAQVSEDSELLAFPCLQPLISKACV